MEIRSLSRRCSTIVGAHDAFKCPSGLQTFLLRSYHHNSSSSVVQTSVKKRSFCDQIRLNEAIRPQLHGKNFSNAFEDLNNRKIYTVGEPLIETMLFQTYLSSTVFTNCNVPYELCLFHCHRSVCVYLRFIVRARIGIVFLNINVRKTRFI